MALVQDFSQTGFTMQQLGASEYELPKSREEVIEANKRYIPYIPVKERDMPNMATLISLPSRHYLKPKEKVHHGDRFIDYDKPLTSTDYDSSTPILDLGTAALQRIVSQMKSLKYDDVAHKSYSKESARLAGLKPYTDYIHDKHKMKRWRAPHSIHKPKSGDRPPFKPQGYRQ